MSYDAAHIHIEGTNKNGAECFLCALADEIESVHKIVEKRGTRLTIFNIYLRERNV